jgi:transmembrane sensor
VLGTRFELRAEAESLRTVVVEGRVEVSNADGTVDVGAGEMAVARTGGGPPATTTPPDVYALLDWPEGTLVFQGTPLHQVAEEVTRFFGRPLRVPGAAIRDRRITAWFQEESFDEVAEALCQAAGAVCRAAEGGVLMDAPVGRDGGAP